jgi:hypothetical protein
MCNNCDLIQSVTKWPANTRNDVLDSLINKKLTGNGFLSDKLYFRWYSSIGYVVYDSTYINEGVFGRTSDTGRTISFDPSSNTLTYGYAPYCECCDNEDDIFTLIT